MITNSDLRKILDAIAKYGKKDSQLQKAHTPLTGKEYMSIIQDGINKIATLGDMYESLDFPFGFEIVEDHTAIENPDPKKVYREQGENQYVDYMYQDDTWEKLAEFNFPGIDSEPIEGSRNLVESDGIFQFKNSIFEENRQMVNSIMKNYKPVEVYGNVSNASDEEDLTSVNVQGTDVLKFKNKSYNSLVFSGLGKTYLRKNIQEVTDGSTSITKNIFTQEMISEPNTIYNIQYEYDLNGATITVPENCILQFDGGKLGNGTIVSNNTVIKADAVQIFNLDIELDGTWAVSEAYSEWFGARANSNEYQEDYINKCLESFNIVKLLDGNYKIDKPIILTSYQSIAGSGEQVSFISKTTNTTATSIPVTYRGVNLNTDSIIIVKPKSDDTSTNKQYNYVTIKNIGLRGSINDYGIIASDGRYFDIINVDVYRCKIGVCCEYSWRIKLDKVRITNYYAGQERIENSIGVLINSLAPSSGYTLTNFNDCYVDGYDYGFKIHNTTYGIMNNCACDAAIISSYYFYNCYGFTINSNGNEAQEFSNEENSACYTVLFSDIVMNSCFSIGNGSESVLNKYWLLAKNNSNVQVVNYNFPETYKISCSAYSFIRIMGHIDSIQDSNLICDTNSTIELSSRNNHKQIGVNAANISFNNIATKNVASETENGLLPAGYVFKTSGIATKDANQITKGFYFVDNSWSNLPFSTWGGYLQAISSGKYGYQIALDFASNNFWIRNIVNGTYSPWNLLTFHTAINGVLVPTKGSTRPSLSQNNVGFQFFDTTLNKPIYWTGSSWIDATGTEV